MTDDVVLFREIPLRRGLCLGVATLNSPRTLNSLSLAMCRQLQARLDAWAASESVVAVVLHGAGGKAFCAGGDLQALYHAMLAEPSGDAWANRHAREFFAAEYRLDYSIHTFPKPIVCWGDGIVMGGGVGLMMGASHRVVTAATRLAMPEITIGLFPDTAGSWMFARLPPGIGIFLALTGARLGAADCLQLGLADRECAPQGLDALLAALADASWSADPARDARQVDDVLQACSVAAAPAGPLQRHFRTIRQTCAPGTLERIAQGIARWQDGSDPWLAAAAATFLAGSPGTARLACALQQRARHQSLAQALRMEYVAALHCCAQPDLREGIRALLIDKDRAPRWQPATLQEASCQWVQRFFVAPWPHGQAHPLADLA